MPSRHPDEWTDFNTHDPGITILEAVAYRLADLSYSLRDRLLAARCGWRCALLVAAGVATVAVLTYRRQVERPRGAPQQG